MRGHTESVVAAVESVPKGVFVMLGSGRPEPLVLVIIVEITNIIVLVLVLVFFVVVVVVHFSILAIPNLSLIVTAWLRTRTDKTLPSRHLQAQISAAWRFSIVV